MNKKHNQHTIKYQRAGKLQTQQITMLGIVLAGRIILSYVPSMNFGTYAEIGFGFIGTALSGILFGPWYALIVSVANDLITSLLHGQNFFLGFVFSAALGGYIYGKLLWRQAFSWRRTFLAVLLVTLIINLGLNSLWLKIMFDQAWIAFMPLRIGKNLVSLPLNTLMLGLIFQNPTIRRLINQYKF